MRWLSLGQSSGRLFEMMPLVMELIYEKVQQAGKKRAKEAFQRVKNPDFWKIVSYLADIFAMFNKGCKKMQGDRVNMLDTKHAITSIISDTDKMLGDLSSNNENLVEFKYLKKSELDDNLKEHLIGHLKEVQNRYVMHTILDFVSVCLPYKNLYVRVHC